MRKVTIEEEIDADMQNVVEPITIEKNDRSKLYRSIRCMCGKDKQDTGEEMKMEKLVEKGSINIYRFSRRKSPSVYLCANRGIMQLKPNGDSSRRNQKYMHYHQKSRRK